ncbi:MAG: immunoglobulin domain-containing protein [Planctomycetes bacterium]|nr:immunoglobulin domain-containing protein [Planctomycetota bacterium]
MSKSRFLRCPICFALLLIAWSAAPVHSQCQPAWNTDIGTQGPNNTVFAIASFNDGSGPAVYAGGFFTTAGASTTRGIARWNGISWSGVNGTGLNTSGLSSMLVFDDGSGPALFVGGFFQSIDGVTANCIAKWNGLTWSPLGAGVTGTVYAMTSIVENGVPALYVGGNIVSAGGQPVNNAAKWKNNTWTPLGTGVNDQVYALTTFDDGNGPAVYYGGRFTTANGLPIAHIAKWDGNNFSGLGQLGDLTSDHAHSMGLFFDNGIPRLYIGGFFANADQQLVRHVTRWNGTSYQPFHNGFNSEPKAYANFDDRTGTGARLYVGGDFNASGLTPVPYIGVWNGSVWQSLGTGLNNNVYAAVTHDFGTGEGPSLCVGGSFTTAGGAACVHVARWMPSPAPAITQQPILSGGVAGGSAVLSIQAVGGPGTSILWYRNNSPLSDDAHISGATTNTLTVISTTANDNGLYHAVASNTCGQAQSQSFNLQIVPACAGDMFADAKVDGHDVSRFVDCILTGTACAASDLDADSLPANVDTDDDMAEFVTKLLRVNSACP